MSRLLFIHGLWLTSASWNAFRERAEARGHVTSAEEWPHLDAPVKSLQHDPPKELATLGITELTDHYAEIIGKMAEPPMIIGHSLGGLVAQLLLDRGIGRAGVSIDPAPVRGVLPAPRAVLSNLGVLARPLGWRRIHRMSVKGFKRDFANTLDPDAMESAYSTHIIPAPGRPFFQLAFAAMSRTAAVKPGPDTPPLMLIAGGEDHTVTPGMVRATHKRYEKAKAPVVLKEVTGRSHWITLEPGWEQVADAALDWIEATVTAGRTPAG